MMTELSGNDMIAQKYATDFSIPLEVAQILVRRLPVYTEAKNFLFPSLDLLHDPRLIPDIQPAAKEVIKAIKQGEQVLIYCHDDTDGYTSAAIIYQTLVDLSRHGHEAVYIYPIVREKDGYILNRNILREYKQKGVSLVVTADFGISSNENFRIADAENLRLIVCDHHETNLTDFPSLAVNPKRKGSTYPFRELAGVGVALKFAQVIYQEAFGLTPQEFYNLKRSFFLVACIGTITDRVTLQNENRTICVHGLESIDQIDEPWLKFFKKNGRVNLARIMEEIIPVLASAAYFDPNLGVGILTSNDEDYITQAIAQLRLIDSERRQTTDLLFKEAVSAAKIYPGIAVAIVPFPKQHYFGAVSARMRDYFGRTAVAINLREGSCFGEVRSCGLDLHAMLSTLGNLFSDFGGHKKAAGFSMPQSNLDQFIDKAVAYISQRAKSEPVGCPPSRIAVEAFLAKTNIHMLEPLAPFGEGNPSPVLTDGENIYTIDNKFNIINLETGI